MNDGSIPRDRSLELVDPKAHLTPDMVARLRQEAKGDMGDPTFEDYIAQPSAWGGVVCALFSFLSLIGGSYFFTLVFAGVTFFLFHLANRAIEKRKNGDGQSKSIILSCPLCHDNIDLASSWSCGSCGQIHNENLETGRPIIPLQRCENHLCQHRPQNGFQCPSCHHHIVVDKTNYIGQKCYEPPYRYVARFTEDNSRPIPQKPSLNPFSYPGSSDRYFED